MPVHKINGNLHLKYKSWSLAWWQAYTDAVFLLADNSESLPGYWLSHFSLGRHLKFQALKVNLNIKINNLFDKDYEVVAGRPMPGRHYALSLNLQFK